MMNLIFPILGLPPFKLVGPAPLRLFLVLFLPFGSFLSAPLVLNLHLFGCGGSVSLVSVLALR